jgi:hypothetical protein
MTICLLILSVFYFKIGWPLAEGQSMKREQLNKLRRLYFIPQRGLIVGASRSDPNGSIRFWSVDEGKLKEVLDLGKGVWAYSLAVNNSGNLVATSLLGTDEIALYSLTEKKMALENKLGGKKYSG